MLEISFKCFVLMLSSNGPLYGSLPNLAYVVLPSFTQRSFWRENPQTACSFRPLPRWPRSSALNSQHGATRIHATL